MGAVLEHAQARPSRPAVKDLDGELTYAQLCHEAALVAAGLADAGAGPGDRVCLHLPNSVDFVVAALACLWRGAIFVPLAVTDPPARLAAILSDCSPTLAITSGLALSAQGGPDQGEDGPDKGEDAPAAGKALPPGPWAWTTVSTLRSTSTAEPRPSPVAPERAEMAPNANEDLAAYAIYTSGTTGSPKGVLIGHKAFAAAVGDSAAALGLYAGTRTLCVSPFHFDGSFGTLFPTLWSGGAVVIRPRDALLFPRTFFNAVQREAITYTGFSPSYLRLLLSSRQLASLQGSSLECVALGGEASSLADVRALWAAAPSLRIFNRYGPTETTIAVTHELLTPETTNDGSVPIGHPHPGVDFYLFDENDQPIADDGHAGELYIGGDQLMMGYWGAPALTQQVMRADLVPGQTVYRTGDVMYRTSGTYFYLGRADRVIKRQGVRISLVELGEAIRNLPDVAAATCVVFDNEGETAIVAFVVSNGRASPAELRDQLSAHLPDTMLPDRVQLVGTLPLTASGKLDERRLLAEAGLRAQGEPSVPL